MFGHQAGTCAGTRVIGILYSQRRAGGSVGAAWRTAAARPAVRRPRAALRGGRRRRHVRATWRQRDRRRAAGRAGVAVARSSCSRRRTTIEFVTTYLALLDGGHVPLLAGEHAERLAAAWDADALVDVDGDELHVVRRSGTVRPRAAPGSGPAAQHVRLDRLAEAGPPVARQRAEQRGGDRHLPRARPPPTEGSRRCRCTTATASRCCTRTWSSERSVVTTDGVRRRPVLRRGHRATTRSRTSPACRTRTSSSNGPDPSSSTSRRCGSSPRPAGGCDPSGSQEWLAADPAAGASSST